VLLQDGKQDDGLSRLGLNPRGRQSGGPVVPETARTARNLLVPPRQAARHDPLVALRLIYQIFLQSLELGGAAHPIRHRQGHRDFWSYATNSPLTGSRSSPSG
jgi:hypothetical protein